MKMYPQQYVAFLIGSLSLLSIAAPSFAEDRLENAVMNHVQQEHQSEKASGALKPLAKAEGKAKGPSTSSERKTAAAPSGARLASNSAVARSNTTSAKSNHEAQVQAAKKHPAVIHHPTKK